MADLRFGTFLAPNLLSTYEAIASAVGQAVGMSTELVVETDYENCVNDVNDVCFVCSLPYIMFEREGVSPAEPVAAPVIKGDRYLGMPIYFSDVIVRHDSAAQSFADLRGSSWSYNEPLSQSGYGITRYHLVQLGETNGYFSDVIEAGFHETSIEMVREGTIAASAIDSHVLAVSMRDDPSLADDVRIVGALGPSTIQPIAVSKRFPAEFREEVRRVLVGLHEQAAVRRALDDGLIDRLVPVAREDYDDIRHMLAACEAANFMEIR